MAAILKAKTNWWKWAWIFTAAVFLLLIGRQCGTGGKFFQCGHGDTIKVKSDTTIYRDTGRIIYKPTPSKVDTFWRDRWHQRIFPDDIIDTSDKGFNSDFILGIDTPAVINDYYAMRYYSLDTNVKGGRVLLLDTVSENKITGRSLFYSRRDTLITNTITLRQPKRIIVYLGITGMARINDPTIGAGLDLSIKGRNDMQYGAGVFKMWNQKQLYGQARIALPIRLSKNR